MGMVLGFVKRYLFEIICGSAAVLGVALIFLGLGAMDEVKQTMQRSVQLDSEITGLSRGGKTINRKAVEAEQERIKQVRRNYQNVMDFARHLDKDDFKPLIPNAFPTPDTRTRLDFQEAYQREIRSWLKTLKAGTEPTELDVRNERDRMEDEQAKMKEMGLDVEEPKDKEDLQPAETPEVRAAIRNARQIYLYADANSFNVSNVTAPGGPMYDVNRPPTPEEMWDAQLEVWIQQDIVNAIARINSEAAEKLKANGRDAWVGTLPIKELISIQLSPGYIRQDSTGATAKVGADRAYPPSTWEDVFTQDKSTDLYELTQFALRMVVDARDIPTIIAGMCQNRFHTPLRVSYKTISPDTSWKGKIYGDDPLVELTIDFETVFFSDFYLAMMPDKVLEKLGKQRPAPPGTEGT